MAKNEIRDAQEFADALTDIARKAIESEEFREQAIDDPNWAIEQVTDDKILVDGVDLVIRDCTTDEEWSGPWPGDYPEAGTYTMHLPKSMQPAFKVHMVAPPRCTCPPLTDFSC